MAINEASFPIGRRGPASVWVQRDPGQAQRAPRVSRIHTRVLRKAGRVLRKDATHPSGFRTRGRGFWGRASAALREAKGVTSLDARENMGGLEVAPVLIRTLAGAAKRCGSLRRAFVAAGLGSRGPPHKGF